MGNEMQWPRKKEVLFSSSAVQLQQRIKGAKQRQLWLAASYQEPLSPSASKHVLGREKDIPIRAGDPASTQAFRSSTSSKYRAAGLPLKLCTAAKCIPQA